MTDAKPKRLKRKKKVKPLVGWREYVALPDLGVEKIKVKVDTGARTSALHVFHLKRVEEEGQVYANFSVHPVQRKSFPQIMCRAPVVDERWIKSSNGEKQLRLVIRTTIRIGEFAYPIELTLTNRDQMGFRMLLGREAIRKRFAVDPGSSYLQSLQS